MQLAFEITQTIGSGSCPDLIHFMDNTATVFYIDSNGRLCSMDTSTPLGDWDGRAFTSPITVSNDSNITTLMTASVVRYSSYAMWVSDGKQRFGIYKPDNLLGNYVDYGEITSTINSPITQIYLKINNEGNALIESNQLSFLAPKSQITVGYKVGTDEIEPIGTFYTDKTKLDNLEELIYIDGRNTIGKYLEEQSFDENNTFASQVASTLINTILANGGLAATQYDVETTEDTRGITFAPNMSLLNGLNELLQTMNNWKIEETADGKVIVGSSEYAGFEAPNTVLMVENTDVWLIETTHDDAEAYSRVCVHNPDFSTKVYANVTSISTWDIESNKTFYIEVPSGMSSTDMTTYASTIAERMSNIGMSSHYITSFRPTLKCGDTAVISSEDATSSVNGIVTKVVQHFGSDALWTEFIMDSGGYTLEEINDYINKLISIRKIDKATVTS